MPRMVGIRELRQNLSVYLKRVREGEHFVVTERGEPVGRLVPLIEDEDPIDRLIAEGKLKPPTSEGDLLDLVPIFDAEESKAIREAFEEQREERLR